MVKPNTVPETGSQLYDRLVKNRRTNLGVLVLLAGLLLFGVLVAIMNAQAGSPVRYGIGLGLMLSAGLGLATFSVLLVGKARKASP